MGSTIKTHVSDDSVEDFLGNVTDESKQQDSFVLLEMYKKVTGEPAKMWGTMVGFGTYHYKSERSKQEGDWPRAAFSPRKQYLTLYFMPGFSKHAESLKKLGKHKTSVGCLYINKLADVDTNVLEEMVAADWKEMQKLYPES